MGGMVVFQLRKMVLALLLVFSVFAFAPKAIAQAPQPAPSSQPSPAQQSWIQWGSQLFGADNAAQDNTKANYEAWKNYFQNTTRCWGCELFDKMASVTITMGERGTSAFAPGAITAVSAFMGLWVMWQLYLMLSITHANSPAQSIDTIFNRLVVMMIVLWLLRSNPFTIIMTNMVLPTMGATMSAASTMFGGGTGGGCGGGGSAYPFVQQGHNLLCGMHKEMGAGIGLGAWMIDGAEFSFWPNGKFELFRAIGGGLIMLVFAFMLVIMPFRFFDALVRIATVSAILPIVVLAFLFKPTRFAVKQAATSLLAAMLTFVFTAIAIGIAVQVLHEVASPIFNFPYDTRAAATSTVGGTTVGPVDANDFMVLITAALGMAVMILQAGSLAAEFAGFQGNMGGAGAAGAAAATAVTTGAVSFATGGAAAAGAGATRGVASGAGKLMKMGSGGGGDPGGSGAGAPTGGN